MMKGKVSEGGRAGGGEKGAVVPKEESACVFAGTSYVCTLLVHQLPTDGFKSKQRRQELLLNVIMQSSSHTLEQHLFSTCGHDNDLHFW